MALVLRFVLPSLVGLALVLNSLGHLYPIEPLENHLVSWTGSSWAMAGFMARIFLTASCLAGFFLIASAKRWPAILAIILVILTLFDSFFFDPSLPDHALSYLSDLGLALNTTICAALLILLVLIVRARREPVKPRKRWQQIILILCGLTILVMPTILNPIFPDQLTDQTAKLNLSLEEAFGPAPNLPDALAKRTDQTYLVAFFTPGCMHCRNIARRLVLSAEQSPDFELGTAVFYGDETYAAEFYKATGYQTETNYVEREQFMQITQGSFPKIFYVKDGRVSRRWNGYTMNYFVLDALTSNDLP